MQAGTNKSKADKSSKGGAGVQMHSSLMSTDFIPHRFTLNNWMSHVREEEDTAFLNGIVQDIINQVTYMCLKRYIKNQVGH